MSFSKVGPAGGWSFGAKLTSAQQNQLDADHANALDKSVAGDQLAGVVTMASTAAIKVTSLGAQIVALVTNGIVSQTASGISSTTAQGITAAGIGAIQSLVFGGIRPGVPGGISSNVSQGIQANTTNGIQAMVANSITTNVAGGIADGGNAGGIQSTTPGGIKFNGGSGDWPGLSSRSVVRTRIMRIISGLASGWTNGVTFVQGGATASYQWFALEPLIEGAVLTQVAFTFSVAGAHSTWPLAVFPSFSVQAHPVSSGAFYGNGLELNSGDIGNGLTVPNPGSGAAWNSGGNNQFFLYPCNQNNTINTGLYNYVVQVQDENGTNSQAGNAYLNMALTYTVTQFAYA